MEKEKKMFLNQFAYVDGTERYELVDGSALEIDLAGVPSDTDWGRWSMLHDGSAFRLFFFQGSSMAVGNVSFPSLDMSEVAEAPQVPDIEKTLGGSKIYQFTLSGGSFKYGYDCLPELTLAGIPEDADMSSFSMLHSGSDYRLYLRQIGNPRLLYRFTWNSEAREYQCGPNAASSRLEVTGFPDDTDWFRWSMLHDGGNSRIFFFKAGSQEKLYQGAWNGKEYRYGYDSIEVLTLEGALKGRQPITSMSMVCDDKGAYRLFAPGE